MVSTLSPYITSDSLPEMQLLRSSLSLNIGEPDPWEIIDVYPI
jgi:hypothetical protein